MEFVAYSLWQNKDPDAELQVDYREIYKGPNEFEAWHFVEWDSEYFGSLADTWDNQEWDYKEGTVMPQLGVPDGD